MDTPSTENFKITRYFEEILGAKLIYTQWSWGAESNTSRTIFFRVWKDQIDRDKNRVEVFWPSLKSSHGYPTEKNPALLERIIRASSNPGDLVLDAFGGSGTTLAVSSKCERRWIGIDNSAEALETILNRFENGLEKMGDFVSATKKGSDEPLLPFEEKLNGSKHSATKDFQVLAAAENFETALKIWEKCNAKKRKKD